MGQARFRAGQMLSDLNLPSLAESEVEWVVEVAPVEQALSVDPHVARHLSLSLSVCLSLSLSLSLCVSE